MKTVEVPLDVLEELYENHLNWVSEVDYRRQYPKWQNEMERMDNATKTALLIINKARREIKTDE